MRAIELPVQWVKGGSFPRRQAAVWGAEYSPLCSAEVKYAWNHTSTPRYVFMAWYIINHRDNLTLYFLSYQTTILDVEQSRT
jgi:hypothetical protein